MNFTKGNIIMREGVEKMSADTTAPHLLYCLDYQHKTDPCTSFHSTRVVSPISTNGTHDLGRKRKGTIFDDDSDYLDDDDAKSIKTDCDTKSSSGSGRPSNHSEIEKRRRDKMNGFISEISALVPMCTAMSRKLDKLTVLRMAVQHIKTLRGSATSYGRDSFKPSFMSDEELKGLLQKTSDGFIIVFSCDRGKILHVSENVIDHLGVQQDELLEQSFVDIIHTKDIPSMKQQMTCYEQNVSTDKMFSQKTSGSKDSTVGSSSSSSSTNDFSVFSSGAKRSFYCRMKCRFPEKSTDKEANEKQKITDLNQRKTLTTESKLQNSYQLFYCNGFLKLWPTNFSTSEISNDNVWDSTICHFGCLVLLVRPFKTDECDLTNKREFITRLNIDGRFLYIDQNVSSVLGYLSNEILGSSYYEYIHQEDLHLVAEMHKQILEGDRKITTKQYRLKMKNEEFIKISASWSLFRNPWTHETEFITIKQRVHNLDNTRLQTSTIIVRDNTNHASTLSDLLSQLPTNNHCLNEKGDRTKIGSGKVGKLVVDRSSTSSKNYGINKSVTISTSEPISEKISFQKSTKIHEKHSRVPVTDTNVNFRQKEFQDQTALSVVMNILDDSHMDYSDMLWP